MNIWSQNHLLQFSCFYQRGWFFVFYILPIELFAHWGLCFHLNNIPILASVETALSRARDLGVFTKVNYSSQTGFGGTSVHLSWLYKLVSNPFRHVFVLLLLWEELESWPPSLSQDCCCSEILNTFPGINLCSYRNSKKMKVKKLAFAPTHA